MNQLAYSVSYSHPLRPSTPLVSVIVRESDAINAVIASRRDNKMWLLPDYLLYSVTEVIV